MKFISLFGKNATFEIGYKKQAPNQRFLCLGVFEIFWSKDSGKWGFAFGLPYLFAFGFIV